MLRQRIPSWAALLLSAVLIFSWTWLLARSISYRDPGSRFFDPTRAYEQSYSLHRSAEADQYQEAIQTWLNKTEGEGSNGTARSLYDARPPGVGSRGPNPAVCATFITTARKVGSQYVDRAISSALHNLTPTERRLLDLRVYFSNLDPTIHPAWNGWVITVADATFSPNEIACPEVLKPMQELAEAKDWHAKSGLDYALALENCLENSTAPYIAIFEGDVLLADSWFARVLTGLHEAETRLKDTRWLYMRLFNEERACGFASTDLFGNGLPKTIFLVSSLTAAILALAKRGARMRGSHRLDFLNRPFLVLLCTVVIPPFIILFFQTGKATVLPPSPGLRVEDFGCCTQGIVFPRGEAGPVIKLIREQARKENYDVIMSNYSWINGIHGLALYPMMVQHMGFESIINPTRERGRAIWSMAFENLSGKKLAKEHRKMVGRLFGEYVWLEDG